MGHGASKVGVELEIRRLKTEKTLKDLLTFPDLEVNEEFSKKTKTQASNDAGKKDWYHWPGGRNWKKKQQQLEQEQAEADEIMRTFDEKAKIRSFKSRRVNAQNLAVAPVTLIRKNEGTRRDWKKKVQGGSGKPSYRTGQVGTMIVDGEVVTDTASKLEKRWTERYGSAKSIYDNGTFRSNRFVVSNNHIGVEDGANDARENIICPPWLPKEASSSEPPCSYPFSDIRKKDLDLMTEGFVQHEVLFGDSDTQAEQLDGKRWTMEKLLELHPEDNEEEEDEENSYWSSSRRTEGKEEEEEEEKDLQVEEKVSKTYVEQRYESLQKTRGRIRTCIFALQESAAHWKRLAEYNDSQRRPSIDKFTRRILRPLFLEMIQLNSFDPDFCILTCIGKTKLETFLDVYLDLVKEKLEDRELQRDNRTREEMLLRLVSLAECSLMRGLEALASSGWNCSEALDIVQKRPIVSSKAKKSKYSQPGLSATALSEESAKEMDGKEILLDGVRAHNLRGVRYAIPVCSPSDLTLALITAISLPKLDEQIIRTLVAHVSGEGLRKVLLLATVRANTEGLRILLLDSTFPLANIHDAFVIASKRGLIESVKFLVPMLHLEHSVTTISKAFIAAASSDQHHVVRKLMPMVPLETCLKALQAVRSSKIQTKANSFTLKLLSSWEKIQAFRAVQKAEFQDETSTICQSYFEIEKLLSFLHLAHGITFEGKCVYDICAGTGEALLAACLAQNFAKAVGYEKNKGACQVAEDMVDRKHEEFQDVMFYDEDMDDNNNQVSQPQDIRFYSKDDLEKEMDMFAEADLLLISGEERLAMPILENLKNKCIVACYKSDKNFTKLSNLTPLTTLYYDQEILWQVFKVEVVEEEEE